jgi:transposase
MRLEHAAPTLQALKTWMDETPAATSTKSGLGKAILYSAKRWAALRHFVHDGRIEIDNSAAERALRGVALGRNNYLFAGSDIGGERAATMYSLIGAAKLNGTDPQAYLRQVLERIADHPVNRVDELLRWNVRLTSPAPVHRLAG